MTVWAFGGHWVEKTLDFKLLLQTHEIDLFTFPTLTKSPAEIALSGCDNDNKWKRYLIWPENTLEPSNWLKIFYKVIFIAYFVLKYDKNGILFNLKNYPKKYYQF